MINLSFRKNLCCSVIVCSIGFEPAIPNALASEGEFFLYGGKASQLYEGKAIQGDIVGFSFGYLRNINSRRFEIRLKVLNGDYHGLFGLDLVPNNNYFWGMNFLYGLGVGLIKSSYDPAVIVEDPEDEEDKSEGGYRGIKYWIPLSIENDSDGLKFRLAMDIAFVDKPFISLTLGIGY